MHDAGTHELGQADFARVITVLEHEQQAMRPTRVQRVSYWLYTGFVWGLVLSGLMMVGFALASDEDETSAANIAGIISGVITVLCLLGGGLSFLLNLPLLYKIGRQRLTVWRLGYYDASIALWRAQQKTHWLRFLIARIALGLGSLLCVGGVIILFIPSKRSGWYVFLLCASLLIMFWVLSNGKTWLDMMSSRWQQVTELKQSIERVRDTSTSDEDSPIRVSTDVMRRFSYIENEQIARSRVRAVAESVSDPSAEFSVLSSREVLKAKASLEPTDRVKVEETLDALMLEPKPAQAQPDPRHNFFRYRIADTTLELVYEVDDSNRMLKVVSLHNSTVEGLANG